MKKLLIFLIAILFLSFSAFTLTACDCEHANKKTSVLLQASCTQTGLAQIICNDCGVVLETEEIAKLSHTESEWETISNATCTQSGVKQKTCTDCGVVLGIEEIAKENHTESEWIIDEQANCKDSGLRHKQCLDCGAILIVSSVNTEYNHNYVYGECQLCGAIDSSYMTEGLVYSLINNDTEYSVLGYTGSETNVIIPAIYKGKSVTSIGSSAFEDCYSLTSIEIPNSVTSIGDGAFGGCTSLASIEIPNSVTSIGDDAFDDCDSLTYNIKDGLKYLGNSSNPYLYLADTVGTSITTATIDSNCRFIGSSAFAWCTSLTSIEIPNSVTSIGFYAFYGCDSLTSITFSDTSTWYRTGYYYDWNNKTGGNETDVTNSSTNATYFKSTYVYYYWYKK